MYNIAKLANFGNKGAREMEFGLFGGRKDGGHIDLGLVEISKTYLWRRSNFSMGGTIWHYSSHIPVE